MQPLCPHAFLLVLLAFLLVTLPAAVGVHASPEGIALPRVGTLGQAPSGDDTIVVHVTGDGRIHLGDAGPLGLVELRDALMARTADPASREVDRSSKKRLLVNADASLPWVVSQWIMQTAAEPRVGIYQVFFGARPKVGDEAGAIGWQLPKDRGLQATLQRVEPAPTVSVKVFHNEAEVSDPEALFVLLAAWKRRFGNLEGVAFEIKAPPPRGAAVPTGFILQVVDVAARAGFEDLRFEGGPPVAGSRTGGSAWVLEEVARLKAQSGTPTLRFGTETVGRLPEGAVTPPARGLLDAPYVVAPAPTAKGPAEEAVEGDLPFEAPETDNGVIGLGGGAGGAFRGRGGSRDLGQAAGGRPKAIEAGLAWLAAHQSEDGSWDADGFSGWCDGAPVEEGPDGAGKALHDVGVTGLVLCAFLGDGYTNRGRHAYAKVVSKGLRWLKVQQDAEGCFGARTHQHFVYGHALAARAMVEAYSMTGSPIFKGAAQRGLDFIALCRNPYFAWRYGVKPGDNDISVTGWMVLPLQMATLVNDDATSRGKPAPLVIDEEAFEGARNFLDKMTSDETGRTGYLQRGGSSARMRESIDRFPSDKTEAMTAVGVTLRRFLGEEPETSVLMRKGFDLCLAMPPLWNEGSGRIDLVYWYWGTLAAHAFPAETRQPWLRSLERQLVKGQRRDTTPCLYRGSWDPVGAWGAEGGRLYSTALAVLCLEAQPTVHVIWRGPR